MDGGVYTASNIRKDRGLYVESMIGQKGAYLFRVLQA
jgi:hypothetical protein